MQTFLPYPDFVQSARCLDRQRLGKQRVEAVTIFRALTQGNGWKNHAAVKMWVGYEHMLTLYHNTMINEWVNRGYKNNMPLLCTLPHHIVVPPWLGDEVFHASHRSNLLRKDPKWYGQFGWSEPPDLLYVWPTS